MSRARARSALAGGRGPRAVVPSVAPGELALGASKAPDAPALDAPAAPRGGPGSAPDMDAAPVAPPDAPGAPEAPAAGPERPARSCVALVHVLAGGRFVEAGGALDGLALDGLTEGIHYRAS